MKRLNIVAVLLLMVFLILLFTQTCNFSSLSELVAEKGRLDLSQINFDQVYLLDGEWGVLAPQSDPSFAAKAGDVKYVNIPKCWNNTAMVIPEGSMSYRLHVSTNLPTDTIIALKLTTAYASSVYIEDALILKSDRQQVGFFNTQSKEFDVVVVVLSEEIISVGNQGFRIYMGTPDDMLSFHDSLMIKEELLIGALVIISLFFVAQSYFNKNVRYTLNFSVICFLIAIIIDVGNQNLFTRRLAVIDTDITIFIWYASYCLLLCFVILFIDELCPSRFSNIIKKIVIVMTLIEVIALFFTPVKYYSYINECIIVIGLLICLSAIVIVVLGIIGHVQDAWPNMISLVILLIVYYHDGILYMNATNPTDKIYLYAVYLILIIQMMIQARRIKIYHEQKTFAELSFLQAQIKPHFLHNVINTIISISRYDMDKARELLYDFNTYLRNSFDIKNFKQLVELKHEIKLIEAYLKIEKARFQERLDFSIELPDNLEYLVPPLMIQPIIENAVKHGVLEKPEGGKVEIKIVIKNKKIEFMVKDNGVGISTKQLDELIYRQKKGSVGLVNIQSRLKMLYNEQLEIKSNYGMNTEITWRIPVKIRKEHL